MAIPAKCITVQQARQLQDNWVNTREPAITQARGGQQDAREMVFNIAELEEFLAHDFFPRVGGGIGMTRMISALDTI